MEFNLWQQNAAINPRVKRRRASAGRKSSVVMMQLSLLFAAAKDLKSNEPSQETFQPVLCLSCTYAGT